MSILLLLTSLVPGLYGTFMWMKADNVMEEMAALLMVLIAVVLFSSASIVNELEDLRKGLRGGDTPRPQAQEPVTLWSKPK